MGDFNVGRKQENGALVMTISGQIDEDANFSGIDFSGANKIVLDLNKIASINSCGIREWIKWIRTAPSGSNIAFRNCPKVIVDQINMVAGFLPPNGIVESFYVPYYCEGSGSEKMVLFRKGVEYKEGGEVMPPSNVKCDESGDEMEMDVIEAKYFKFLQKG
ncbi:MAG: anti-sigma factor antagonist [Bdellovibrionales bacterium]|nr:anti-sigma factor antagonist [Bdellovibrionales bacterium]